MGRGEEKGSSFDLSTLRSNKTNLYEDKEKKQNPLKKKLPASGKKSCQFVGYMICPKSLNSFQACTSRSNSGRLIPLVKRFTTQLAPAYLAR